MCTPSVVYNPELFFRDSETKCTLAGVLPARTCRFSFTSSFILPTAVVYLVAAKMASNRSLSVLLSASGHRESSWWTKTTCSSTAFVTFIMYGISVSMPRQVFDDDSCLPVSGSVIVTVPSRLLKRLVALVCVRLKHRVTMKGSPCPDLSCSLINALTSVVDAICAHGPPNPCS